MCKRLMKSALITILILIMLGCNLPSGGDPIAETELPDIVFTKAAETVASQLSSTSTVAVISTPTVPPTSFEPTYTLEPTVTSTPTETPLPTEIPEIIFFDDFSDTSGWYTVENDRYGFKYSEEGYHIYNNINMGLIWSIRDQEYSGIALEVDGTRLEGPEDSYFGVVCKFSDEKNYYALVIGDNGFYGIGLMEDGEFDFIDSGIDGTGVIKKGLGETNRIRGVCNDNHFFVFTNGELLLDIWDDTLEEGVIGLVVGNQRTDIGAEFRFNDFAITWP